MIVWLEVLAAATLDGPTLDGAGLTVPAVAVVVAGRVVGFFW